MAQGLSDLIRLSVSVKRDAKKLTVFFGSADKL